MKPRALGEPLSRLKPQPCARATSCDFALAGGELVIVFHRQKPRMFARPRKVQVLGGEKRSDLVHQALELNDLLPFDLLGDGEESPRHLKFEERARVENRKTLVLKTRTVAGLNVLGMRRFFEHARLAVDTDRDPAQSEPSLSTTSEVTGRPWAR